MERNFSFDFQRFVKTEGGFVHMIAQNRADNIKSLLLPWDSPFNMIQTIMRRC